MRLNETREDSHIAFQILLVYPDIVSALGGPHERVKIPVVAVVLHHPISLASEGADVSNRALG